MDQLETLAKLVEVPIVIQRGEKDVLKIAREALDGRLAKFKQPKRVFFVEALPRNAMGKVQKAALRKTYETAYAP